MPTPTCPPHLPSWLNDFTRPLAAALLADEPLPPLGCHVFASDGEFEVTLFVAATEIVSGEFDGQSRFAPFSVDIAQAMVAFETVDRAGWQAARRGPEDDVGAHLAIQGTFQGHQILARICSEPPRQFPTGQVANVYAGTLSQTW